MPELFRESAGLVGVVGMGHAYQRQQTLPVGVDLPDHVTGDGNTRRRDALYEDPHAVMLSRPERGADGDVS
ncbi:C-5 cytosine-specific DNA methylase [Mycobacterium sp. PO2]|nr:C-5 cytosine-specific DNA methylase [Mycobacterium sp. PO2]